MPHPADVQEGMTVKRIVDFVVDDSGQDLVEYAVTTGMVTVTSLLAAILLALYMGNAYRRVGTGVQALWEPCAPGGCS
jgi:hypothetical protein